MLPSSGTGSTPDARAGGGKHGHHLGEGHGHGGHGMPMYFHNSQEIHVLFESWQPSGDYEYWTLVLFAFALAFVYEWGRHYRQRLDELLFSDSRKLASGGREQLLRTALHACQFAIGYGVMLIFMTYNVVFCLSIVAGSSTGFYLFARAPLNNNKGPAAGSCH